MTPTDKLTRICQLCKCQVTVLVNEHRGYYKPIAKYIEELREVRVFHATPEVEQAIIETDTIVSIYVYPVNTLTEYRVHHYDLNAALGQMLETLEGKQ